jgi:hypothetical protein
MLPPSSVDPDDQDSSSSEASVNIYQTTWHLIQEDSQVQYMIMKMGLGLLLHEQQLSEYGEGNLL